MIWQRLRLALMTSVVLAAAQGAVWADDAKDDDDATEEKMDKPDEKKADAAHPAPAAGSCGATAGACGATTRKICVQEWVPEWYETTRTTYRSEQVQEAYTAYRYENVTECRTRTTYKMVPETREVEKCVCRMVSTCEPRTVHEKVWTCKPCTYTVRKCVDKGHWECREVPCGPTLLDRLHGLKRKKCGNSCDTGCGNECADTCAPVRTRTVRVWCPNKVWCEETCTKMVRSCETVCKTVNVTVCKPVYEKVKCTVTCCKCVPCQEQVNVCVRKCVPFQCTRCVTKCVPVCEKVKACRMVCRTVEKEVACDNGCGNTSCCATDNCCGGGGDACCGSAAGGCGFKLFRGKRCGGGFKFKGRCHSSCAPSCGTSCCK